MTEKYIKFGELLEQNSSADLSINLAQQSYDTILKHPDFTLIECRKISDRSGYSKILIVECCHDGIPTKNSVEILYKERLALRFFESEKLPPETRALRSDFPKTPHQNYVCAGEPSSLCLYFEPWSAIIRNWTPERHLSRILWWLEKSAKNELHATDQPLEDFYFDYLYQLVLPNNFTNLVEKGENSLSFFPRSSENDKIKTIIGVFGGYMDKDENKIPSFFPIILSLPPVEHNSIEHYPATLNELIKQFESRDVDLGKIFCENIIQNFSRYRIETYSKNILLILIIPLIRDRSSKIEKYQKISFVLPDIDPRNIAKEIGVADEVNGEYGEYSLLLVKNCDSLKEWPENPLFPISIIEEFDREFAQKISGNSSLPINGILAGVGALGSSMLNIWLREGWGEWSLVDDDIIKPHNLARHISYESHVGMSKVNALQQHTQSIYPYQKIKKKFIQDSAVNFENNDILIEIENSNLIVDASTTLEVPRELSTRNNIGRVASVFLSPSGLDSVLLYEDHERTLRLDMIEAQYYRAIINNQWGKDHLSGHLGHLWVGAGCRDSSAIIPYELIQLHAATLSRQVRLKYQDTSACAMVWRCNSETSELKTDNIILKKSISTKISSLTIFWDEDIKEKAKRIRSQHLPNETGGIILGYFDLKLSHAYIVDILPAPPDSRGSTTGFSRGTEGLDAVVKKAKDRTANIVDYIGDWHSHPNGCTASPSQQDIKQLDFLSEKQSKDGLKSLMLIISENDEQWLVK